MAAMTRLRAKPVILLASPAIAIEPVAPPIDVPRTTGASTSLRGTG